MNLFLVRHGESLANLQPELYRTTADHAVPLSDRGIDQARKAGEFLRRVIQGDEMKNELPAVSEISKNMFWGKNLHIRLWTSPYRRTRQTADAIMAVAGEVITDRREHINLCEQQFGLFDGIPDEELSIQFPKEHEYYQKCELHEGRFWARMPLGESRFDVAVRVHDAFGTWMRDREKSGVENLVVICHGVTLRSIVMQWLHLTPEWFEDEPNPGNCWIRLIRESQDCGYIYKG